MSTPTVSLIAKIFFLVYCQCIPNVYPEATKTKIYELAKHLGTEIVSYDRVLCEIKTFQDLKNKPINPVIPSIVTDDENLQGME